MSIVEVTPKNLGSQRTQSSDGTVSRQESFTVVSDIPNEDVLTVQHADGVPQFGDSHPDEDECVVVSINPRQRDDAPTVWDVQIGYQRPKIAGEDPKDTGNNGPELDPYFWPQVRIGHRSITEETFTDIYDKPITTARGQPFSHSIEYSISVITLSRFELHPGWRKYNPLWLAKHPYLKTYDPDLCMSYQNVINSEEFWGIGAEKIKVSNEAEFTIQNLHPFWKVTYTLEIHPFFWSPPLLNCSTKCNPDKKNTQEWDSRNKKNTPIVTTPITDSRGTPVSKPRPLDKDDIPIEPGKPLFYLTSDGTRKTKGVLKFHWVVPFDVLRLPPYEFHLINLNSQ
jgi:hypothetical protein